MAINLKEIENRKYDGKELISFEYTVKGLEGPHGEEQELRVWFEKIEPGIYGISTQNPAYKVFTIINSVVYEKIFQMPKSGIPLEIVVATGLNALKFNFLEEANQKEMIAYTIGDITQGM